MAALSIGGTVADGVERLIDRRTAALLGPLFVVQLAVAVGTQSQLAIQRERREDEPAAVGVDLAAANLPLSVDIPLSAAAFLSLAGLVLLVSVTIVALRAFVTVDHAAGDRAADGATSADETRRDDTPGIVDERSASGDASGPSAGGGPSPSTDPSVAGGERRGSLEFDALPSATASGIGAAVASLCAIGVGLVALVLPGLYLAAALAFALPYVATTGAGALESLRSSWRLTRGNRLRVFAVLLAAWTGYVAVSVVGATVAALSGGVAGGLVVVAADAVAWLFSLAVLAAAFDRLERLRAAEATRWEGVDDELLP